MLSIKKVANGCPFLAHQGYPPIAELSPAAAQITASRLFNHPDQAQRTNQPEASFSSLDCSERSPRAKPGVVRRLASAVRVMAVVLAAFD